MPGSRVRVPPQLCTSNGAAPILGSGAVAFAHGDYLSGMWPHAPHPPNALHGITLERMLTELVEHKGWEKMARRVKIACFTSDPSISSSLKFLRKTPWARTKVERMYLDYRGDFNTADNAGT